MVLLVCALLIVVLALGLVATVLGRKGPDVHFALAAFLICGSLSAHAAETCVPFDGSRLTLASNSIRVCAPWTDAAGAALVPAKAEIQKCEVTAVYGQGNTLTETITIQGSSPLTPGAIATAQFANAFTLAGDSDDTLAMRCFGRADKTITGAPLAWAGVAPQPATFRALPGLGLPGRAVDVP